MRVVVRSLHEELVERLKDGWYYLERYPNHEPRGESAYARHVPVQPAYCRARRDERTRLRMRMPSYSSVCAHREGEFDLRHHWTLLLALRRQHHCLIKPLPTPSGLVRGPGLTAASEQQSYTARSA